MLYSMFTDFDKDGSSLLEINSVTIQASGNNSQQYFHFNIPHILMKELTIAFTRTQKKIKKKDFCIKHFTIVIWGKHPLIYTE